MATNTPSLSQLKRAVEIAEKIQALQSELNSVLGSTGGETALAGIAPKKRGRKPGSKVAAKGVSDIISEVATNGRKKKRVMSPEARAKIAEAQKKRWAKHRKAAK